MTESILAIVNEMRKLTSKFGSSIVDITLNVLTDARLERFVKSRGIII